MESLTNMSAKPADSFQVEGFLISADVKSVSLLMPPYTLEIIAEDVLAVEELPPLPQQRTDVGIAVRLTVKHGFRLWNISSGTADEQHLFKTRRPFAIVTRAPQAQLQDDGSYAEREQAFLRSRGIELPL